MSSKEKPAEPSATLEISSVSVEQIAEAVRSAGYRATVAHQNGNAMLQSAAQGLGFIVTPGNPAPSRGGHFIDYSFSCLIRIDGPLPEGLIAEWNESKRFSRMFLQNGNLVLAMDVFVAGGVSERFLQAQCELWDRLMHDFIAHLKQTIRPAVAA